MSAPAAPGPRAADAPRPDPLADPPPPALRSWVRVYSLVLGWLGILVLLMYGFTLHYR